MSESPRARHLRVKYGISEAQFEELASRWDGKCWVCGKVPKGRLQVDHQHTGPNAGEIRGLLCWWDNKCLSHQWTRERLAAALEYMDPNNWTGLFVPEKKKRKRKKRLTS